MTGHPAEPGHEPLRERLRTFRFGPSALATPANAITMARLLATPVLVVLVVLKGPGWPSFAIAFAIGATDGIDGYIARRQGTTRSGAFLDPLADKFVVLSALFVLAAKSEIAWLPVALIAAREVSITLYRSAMGRRGVSIPARRSAKVKTLVQGIAILLALAPGVAPHKTVVGAVLWVAVAFTLVTGMQYLLDGRRVAQRAQPAHSDDGSLTPPVSGGPSAPPVVPPAPSSKNIVPDVGGVRSAPS